MEKATDTIARNEMDIFFGFSQTEEIELITAGGFFAGAHNSKDKNVLLLQYGELRRRCEVG